MNKKNIKDLSEKELLTVLIEVYLNKLIFNFKDSQKLSPEEISEQLEIKEIKPKLYSDKLLIELLFDFISKEGKKEKKDFKLSLKDLKDALKSAENKKRLERWGEKNLLVTKKFLKTIKYMEEYFDIEIEFKESESEEFLSKGINSLCPKCEKTLPITGKEGIYEVDCPNCKEKIKIVSGKIKKIRGRLNSIVSYGPESISLTLSINKKEIPINFYTRMRLTLSTGDKIGLFYTRNKKLFSKNVEEKLNLIDNFTINQAMRV